MLSPSWLQSSFCFYHLTLSQSVEKTAKALVAKGHAATVVSSRKEALDTLIALMPEGSTIMNASSTSLVRILFSSSD